MKPNPNLLLVEGKDDKLSVIHLIKARLGWPAKLEDAPVFIRDCDGATNLLNREFINTNLKSPGLRNIGIVLDADEDIEARWNSIRSFLCQAFPNIPSTVPAEGLKIINADGLSLGIWLMPDNVSRGFLETFLQRLIPEEKAELMEHAQACVQSARTKGLVISDVQLDKAVLYTWLAWQDPPGQLCSRAITLRVLDPKHSSGDSFVNWFSELFSVANLLNSQVEVAEI